MAGSQLFAGKKLWFSQQIPQRKWLIENAKAHGADVARLEQQADIILVDHTKKGHAPGTYSYRFVELSIRRGQLEDLSKHAVGSVVRAERPVGSVRTAAKGTRTVFTEADDQLLWNWVKPYENLNGSTKGNEIYKQLERYNNRHTFQSWRDHWIKYTQYQTGRQITSEIGPAYEVEAEEIHEAAPKSSRTATLQRDANDHHRTQLNGTGDDGSDRNIRLSTRKPEDSAMGISQSNVATDTTATTDGHSRKAQLVTSPKTCPKDKDEADKRLHSTETLKEKAKPLAETLEDTHVLPLAYGFTPEIAYRLYMAVPTMLNSADSSVLDRRWHHFMKKYPGHGDQGRWVTYFEENIYPTWLRLEGLDHNDKDEIDDRVRLYVEANQARRAEQAARNVAKRDVETSQSQSEIPESQLTDAVIADDGQQNLKGQSQKPARECANCFDTKTHRWRKDIKGRDLCDACGRFLRENGVMRPSSTWTDPPNASDVEDQSPDDNDENEEIPQKDYDAATESAKAGPAIENITSSIVERPPGPNESRKRSHGRSTQSDSQSQSKSQTTTNSGTISDIPYSAESAEEVQQHELSQINQNSSHSPKRSGAWSDDPIINPKRRKLSPSSGDKQQDQSSVSILSLCSDSDDDSDGEMEQEDSLFDSSGLGAAVVSVTRSRGHDDSPLFVPQDPDDSVSKSESDALAEKPQEDDEADDPNMEDDERDISPCLNLFDEEDGDQDMAEALSEYAASEAPSEGVQFDDSLPQLSQAWDTAPQHEAVDEEDIGESEEQHESVESHQIQQVTKLPLPGPLEVPDGNTNETSTTQEVDESAPFPLEDDVEENADETFETAREKLPIDSSPAPSTNRNDLPAEQISNTNRLETQALFQQSLTNALTDDLFFIPPPEDWESDPEFEVIGENAIDPSKAKLETIKEEANDPLSTHIDNASQDPTDSSDEDDPEKIDQFIHYQKQVHSIHKLDEEIIEAIAIRALESTSLRIDLASYVVEAMVSKYIRDKDQSNNNKEENDDNNMSSPNRFDGTPAPTAKPKQPTPKLQPKQIDNLVEALLPDNIQGVWTSRDDEMLYGSDGRLIKRVNDKHGDESLEVRLVYLAEMHQAV